MRNVDIEAVKEFAEKAKQDRKLAEKKMHVKVVWNMEESLPQISSELAFAKGVEKVNIDNAPFMGGKGRAPNPMQYCLLGMAACFLGTFATIAKELGLEISELSAEAEASVNLSKPLGIGDEPINKGIKITLNIKSDESEDKIEHAKKLAIERCPAVYCITNPIPLDVEVRR